MNQLNDMKFAPPLMLVRSTMEVGVSDWKKTCTSGRPRSSLTYNWPTPRCLQSSYVLYLLAKRVKALPHALPPRSFSIKLVAVSEESTMGPDESWNSAMLLVTGIRWKSDASVRKI